ncbi:MAG: type I-E CRISPR-associated endoribonuclease Cas2 [Sedimentisphaerales bacterium]|nr:type I-E CRISPR-associated endoribonuclease Cas2 [Sedimentisphaerales bacterium]
MKGELSRWLIEPISGVFLGNPTVRIRDILWEKAVEKRKQGYILQIWDYPCAQGYQWRSLGDSRYILTEMEGLTLIKKLSLKKNLSSSEVK